MIGPERWQRVQELFHQAVGCPPLERAALLRRECAGDARLLAEVELLLHNDRENENDLCHVVEEAASGASGSDLIGTRLGAYRIQKEIGRGGMGSVYLATRDDAQYRKQVAIKVIRRGMDTEDVLTRFRHEREILAALDHPYIAHLLDGGTTPDGRPYLVMEYVEGQPITQYVLDHRLTVEEKLELFCQVCEAVSFAHRNLIVHRDLKPGNIFITRQRTPRLLDFGIAKLLHSAPDAPSHTQTLTAFEARMLTPDYASPEQIRGMPVSTSSDVYSLGVVLFELLTGTRPYATERGNPTQLERAVCVETPRRPSEAATARTTARRLSGDLDTIVLMALRKEPERRYSSADQFAADVRRHLASMPVVAREDTLRYRASKFVRRHSLAVLAAALVLICLMGGVAMAVWQAGQARQQRTIALEQQQIAVVAREHAETEAHQSLLARKQAEQATGEARRQKDIAVRESGLSSRRLHEMINLANKTVFEMHDQLASLPGATEPRRKLISGVLGYLDSIGKEAGDDPFVLLSLASAYYKLGDVQGRPEHPSLGDYTKAGASYGKAAQFAERLLLMDSRDPRYLLVSSIIHTRQAELLRERGALPDGVRLVESAVRALAAIREPRASSEDVLLQLATSHESLFWLNSQINDAAGMRHAQMALAVASRLHLLYPASAPATGMLADSYSALSAALILNSRIRPALDCTREAQRLRRQLLALRPRDPLLMRTLMLSHGRMGDLLGGPFLTQNLGDPKGALESYTKAVRLAEQIAEVDPANQEATADVATALLRAGLIEVAPGQRKDSLALLQKSQEILEALLKKDPRSRRYLHDLSMVLEFAGHRLRDMGRAREAMRHYERSLTLSKAWIVQSPELASGRIQAFADYQAMAPLAARLGEFGRAQQLLAEVEDFVSGSDQLAGRIPSMAAHRPKAWMLRGEVYEILSSGSRPEQMLLEACSSYRNGLDAWNTISSSPAAADRNRNEIEGAQKQLSACQARVALQSRKDVK